MNTVCDRRVTAQCVCACIRTGLWASDWVWGGPCRHRAPGIGSSQRSYWTTLWSPHSSWYTPTPDQETFPRHSTKRETERDRERERASAREKIKQLIVECGPSYIWLIQQCNNILWLNLTVDEHLEDLFVLGRQITDVSACDVYIEFKQAFIRWNTIFYVKTKCKDRHFVILDSITL